MTKIKTSIRLALTDFLREAFDVLKRTRYPFMKEDEILKLALSQLYAAEHIPSSRQVTISYIMAKIRTQKPDFATSWMKHKGIKDEDLDVSLFCEMIVDLISIQAKKETKTNND